MMGSTPRVAAASGDTNYDEVDIYDWRPKVGPFPSPQAPDQRLGAPANAQIVSLRSALDSRGVYHLMAVFHVDGPSLVLSHYVAGGTDWASSTTLTTANIVSVAVTLAADDSVEAVWAEADGSLWEYNDHHTGNGVSSLLATANVTAGVDVHSAGATQPPTVLYGTATSWLLLEGGTSSVVLGETPNQDTPALLATSSGWVAAVYHPDGKINQA